MTGLIIYIAACYVVSILLLRWICRDGTDPMSRDPMACSLAWLFSPVWAPFGVVWWLVTAGRKENR